MTLALEAEEGNDAHDPFAEAEDLDEEEEFDPDPYSLIKSLPPLEQVVDPWRRCMLPRQTRNRKTLVGSLVKPSDGQTRTTRCSSSLIPL